MFLLCGRICLRGILWAKAACGGFFGRRLPAGRGRIPAADSACGQGLRTGAHLRCFPSRRCAAGPSRSRSHGRLRRPKSLPIRHSSAAAQCSSPWDGGIAPVLTFWLHRFVSLSLKSRIDARFSKRTAPRLHRFASLSLNSRIDAAPSCRQVEWPARSMVVGRLSQPHQRPASDSNFRRVKEA